MLCSVGYQATATRSHIVHGPWPWLWSVSGLKLSSPATPRLHFILQAKWRANADICERSRLTPSSLPCVARTCVSCGGDYGRQRNIVVTVLGTELAPCRRLASRPAPSLRRSPVNRERRVEWGSSFVSVGTMRRRAACHKPCQTTWCCSCCVVFDILQKIHFDGLSLKNPRMTNLE